MGHGTTIKIYLPRFYGAANVPKALGTQEPAPASGREVVLLVEDDEQVLLLTSQSLRDLGYGVIEESGGANALVALAAHPEVRLLLTDSSCRR